MHQISYKLHLPPNKGECCFHSPPNSSIPSVSTRLEDPTSSVGAASGTNFEGLKVFGSSHNTIAAGIDIGSSLGWDEAAGCLGPSPNRYGGGVGLEAVGPKNSLAEYEVVANDATMASVSVLFIDSANGRSL
ncbi:hypothetical protein CRG98_014681 [Punica granatum]|uniref:Uncharacterized protein n=1 Tax=Punica granatum TaxID=22663 RepID=A0A2I0K8S3_PUNGR|nr:hypothetical protein CRG98_014681 [Punica granatum]